MSKFHSILSKILLFLQSDPLFTPYGVIIFYSVYPHFPLRRFLNSLRFRIMPGSRFFFKSVADESDVVNHQYTSKNIQNIESEKPENIQVLNTYYVHHIHHV